MKKKVFIIIFIILSILIVIGASYLIYKTIKQSNQIKKLEEEKITLSQEKEDCVSYSIATDNNLIELNKKIEEQDKIIKEKDSKIQELETKNNQLYNENVTLKKN